MHTERERLSKYLLPLNSVLLQQGRQLITDSFPAEHFREERFTVPPHSKEMAWMQRLEWWINRGSEPEKPCTACDIGLIFWSYEKEKQVDILTDI